MGDSSLFGPKAAVMGEIWSVPQPLPPPPMGKDGQLRRNNESVNAVSFGFVATAVLITAFLVMAIVETFLRPRSSLSPASPIHGRESVTGDATTTDNSLKRDNAIIEYVSDISVIMPGHDIPTFIAKQSPILCPSDGIYRHGHTGSCSLHTRQLSTISEKSHEELMHPNLNLIGSSVAPPESSVAS